MPHPIFLFCILAFITCGLTQELWIYALTKTKLKLKIIDVPNMRSSHVVPTPRGGGALFCFFACASFVGLAQFSFMPWAMAITMIATSCLLSLVGLWDDLKGLNARSRFLTQLFVVYLNAVCYFHFLKYGVPVWVLLTLFLFWMVFALSLINFYNFADGINGYIALQFILATPIFAGLCSFLWNNMVKKNIFMGDTGSTFLGLFLSFVFFLLSVWQVDHGSETNFNSFLTPFSLLLTWIFFSQCIFLDCACMVIAKKILKIPFSKPHKLHFYQILSRQEGMTHTKTTFYIACLQFLLNIAFLAAIKLIDKTPLFIFTFIYLCVVSFVAVKKHLRSIEKALL